MDHAGFPAFCYALTGRPFSSDPKEFLDGLLQGAIMLAVRLARFRSLPSPGADCLLGLQVRLDEPRIVNEARWHGRRGPWVDLASERD